MDVKKDKNKKNGQSGQAFFEFILFVPFLISLMLLLVKISSAINGSINQQKVTRGYFYYLIKNNSRLPDNFTLNSLQSSGLTQFGFYAIGWRESEVGETPVAPCYSLDPFLGGSREGSCDEALNGATRTTYIKPVTAYGVCSTVYQLEDGEYLTNPLNRAGSIGSSCSLQ